MLRTCLLVVAIGSAQCFRPVLRPTASSAPSISRLAAINSPTGIRVKLANVEMSGADFQGAPPLDTTLAPPIPKFSWPRILFFVANPLALMPVAGLAWAILRVDVMGSAYAATTSAAASGAMLAMPMLVISLVADKFIPALEQVTEASQCMTLYAMGGRSLPVRAFAAATLISTSAAVAEEIAFRGVLQTAVQSLLVWASAPYATAAAVVVQALVFGVLHSYTSSVAYLATATVAGLAFGAAFASTSNLAVPIAMHFVIDMVGFLVCHYKVSKASETAQRDLMMADSPIARSLRRIFEARQQQESASVQQAASAEEKGP